MDPVTLGMANANAKRAVLNGLDLPGGWVGGVVGTRRAAFRPANGNKGTFTNNLADAHQRVPVCVPVKTTRWRLRIGNTSGDNVAATGAINFTGFYLGKAALTAGVPTGVFAATPASVLPGFTSPVDGSDTATGWVTDPAQQFDPDTIYLLSMGWTKDVATALVNGPAIMWYGSGGNGSAAANSLGSGLSQSNDTAFAIQIEYEFQGGNRVLLAVGDSLTEGSTAGFAYNTWHQRVSRRLRVPVVNMGLYGRTAANLNVANRLNWTRLTAAGCTVDGAILQIGINDAAASVTLADYQIGVAGIRTILTNMGVRDLYANTVAPRNSLTSGSAGDNLRKSYNDWLRTMPLGIKDLFNVEEQIWNPSSTSALRTDLDAGDGVHWTVSGHWHASSVVRP